MTCVAETIVYFQVAFHKRNTRRACQSAYPRNESVHAHTCNKAQPEPDEAEIMKKINIFFFIKINELIHT